MGADNKRDSFEYIMGVINSVGEKNPIHIRRVWGGYTRKTCVRSGIEYSIDDCADGYEYRFAIEKRRGRLTQYRVERVGHWKPLYFALESVPVVAPARLLFFNTQPATAFSFSEIHDSKFSSVTEKICGISNTSPSAK